MTSASRASSAIDCCPRTLASRHAKTTSNRINKAACEAVMIIEIHNCCQGYRSAVSLAFGEAEHAFAYDIELNLGCPTSDGGRTGAQKAELPGTLLHCPG